jgi:hypothetical protein
MSGHGTSSSIDDEIKTLVQNTPVMRNVGPEHGSTFKDLIVEDSSSNADYVYMQPYHKLVDRGTRSPAQEHPEKADQGPKCSAYDTSTISTPISLRSLRDLWKSRTQTPLTSAQGHALREKIPFTDTTSIYSGYRDSAQVSRMHVYKPYAMSTTNMSKPQKPVDYQGPQNVPIFLPLSITEASKSSESVKETGQPNFSFSVDRPLVVHTSMNGPSMSPPGWVPPTQVVSERTPVQFKNAPMAFNVVIPNDVEVYCTTHDNMEETSFEITLPTKLLGNLILHVDRVIEHLRLAFPDFDLETHIEIGVGYDCPGDVPDTQILDNVPGAKHR